MFMKTNPKLVANFRLVSISAAATSAVLAILALTGWIFDFSVLENLALRHLPMPPMGAVLLILSAVSYWLLSKKEAGSLARRAGYVLAAAVCLSALVVLARNCLHVPLDLEGLLFGAWLPEVFASYTARLAANEAMGILLLAGALLALRQDKNSFHLCSQLLAVAAGAISFFALVGYWYGVPFFYGVATYTQMALPTAIAMIIQAVAIFFAKPEYGVAGLITSDAAGGVMLRRLLPTTILIPLIYGWLKLVGQRLDLFERDFGTALLILLMIVSTVVVVVLNAKHLNDVDAERERLLEQRDNVMAVLTHDLKNPLIGADRVLSLLVTGALGGISKEQAEVLSKLKASNEDLLNSIQNLLELYRYDRGAETLHIAEVNLLPIIGKCLEELKPHADNRRLAVRTLLPEQLGPVKADATAIKHVMTNLIHNAIKFTPEGGGIEISAQELNGLVIVKVKDTGKGISKEEQESLFQPFTRGTLGKKYKTGTGLGLYLCYQIVKAHHGYLTCMSEPGSGTTFVISLPTKIHLLELPTRPIERVETG